MKKCEFCYLKDAKPCYECNTCAGGDDHFRPVPKQTQELEEKEYLSVDYVHHDSTTRGHNVR